MATITTINSGDTITASRAVINNNFANLNSDKLETSVVDVDTTLAANSDAKVPSQKAIKAYVDSRTAASSFNIGATSYDLSTASGSQNIPHGLTGTPSIVRITAYYSNLALNNASELTSQAFTLYNGVTQASVYTAQNAASSATGNHSVHGNLFRIYGGINPANYQQGTVTVNGTNITIAWTKTGTPTGIAYITWEANV